MQENYRLVMLNGNLTDDEIMRAIRYLDPDLFAEKNGEDAGTLLGICITLLTVLTGTLTYIYLYIQTL
jgi:hypothetical protein